MAETMRDSDELDYAYRMGRDYALNGPNNVNCHYTIFATVEMKDAWERGRDEVTHA